MGVCRTFAKVNRGWKPAKRCLDVWGEISERLKRWGGRVKVRWIRSHAEERQADRTQWTELEWGNHIADRMADEAYSGGGGMVMRCRWQTR